MQGRMYITYYGTGVLSLSLDRKTMLPVFMSAQTEHNSLRVRNRAIGYDIRSKAREELYPARKACYGAAE